MLLIKEKTEKDKRMLKNMIKDPFVHFMALGALIFLITENDITFPSNNELDKEEIVVNHQIENLLFISFKANQGRHPTDLEKQSLIDNYIREEILVREAIELGLNQNDHVIRTRLVELVNTMGLANTPIEEPSEQQLQQLAEADLARYASGGQFSLEHIYLGQAPSPDIIRQTETALEQGHPPTSLGQPSKFGFRLNHASKETIIELFGPHFFQAALDVELKEWSAPTPSPLGIHLVRVVERTLPSIPPIEKIRYRLTSDWHNQQKTKLLEDIYQQYRKSYSVIYIKGDEE